MKPAQASGLACLFPHMLGGHQLLIAGLVAGATPFMMSMRQSLTLIGIFTQLVLELLGSGMFGGSTSPYGIWNLLDEQR